MLQKYHKNTPTKEKTPEGIAYAMKVGAKEKTSKLNMKMIKLVEVANLAHTPNFFKRGKFCIYKMT